MPSPSLPAGLRHGYGVGAFSIAVANTAMMFFLLKYLVDVAGLSPGWAGTVLFVGKGWDAFADPLAGWLSDRTVSPMGPRRPWILYGSVPFALSFVATFWGLPWSGTIGPVTSRTPGTRCAADAPAGIVSVPAEIRTSEVMSTDASAARSCARIRRPVSSLSERSVRLA